MPFEADLSRRAKRSWHLSELAYGLRAEARGLDAKLKGMRATRSRIQRRLSKLCDSANRTHEKSCRARYVSPGRVRACNNRYDLIHRIIEEISETLLDLQEQIDEAEMAYDTLRCRAEAATLMAEQASLSLKKFGEDRKHLVAWLAGVPDAQLQAGLYKVHINSREPNKIDVYYNLMGLEPLGEGHGHIVLSFDCSVREHRPPAKTEGGVRRIAPKPSPGLFRRAPRQQSVPLAA